LIPYIPTGIRQAAQKSKTILPQEEQSNETTDQAQPNKDNSYVMLDNGTDNSYMSMKDVADPKSLTWRYKCNANGVPLASTLIGIQGCQ
jgi:hypothetical protein